MCSKHYRISRVDESAVIDARHDKNEVYLSFWLNQSSEETIYWFCFRNCHVKNSFIFAHNSPSSNPVKSMEVSLQTGCLVRRPRMNASRRLGPLTRVVRFPRSVSGLTKTNDGFVKKLDERGNSSGGIIRRITICSSGQLAISPAMAAQSLCKIASQITPCNTFVGRSW